MDSDSVSTSEGGPACVICQGTMHEQQLAQDLQRQEASQHYIRLLQYRNSSLKNR